MSRTYRRLKGDMHYRRVRRYVLTEDYGSREVRDWSPLTRSEIMDLVHFHMDGRRTMGQIPSWHWNETFHVPVRAKTRNLLRNLLRLNDLEEAPLFPGESNRPKEWFW